MSRFPIRRNANRISQYDYSKPGYYFITICIQNRMEILGSVKNSRVQLNNVGVMIFAMVQWFKTMTTNKYIQNIKTSNWQPFDKCLWQRNYYDHVIGNHKSLDNIRRHITINPSVWQFDQENLNREIRNN